MYLSGRLDARFGANGFLILLGIKHLLGCWTDESVRWDVYRFKRTGSRSRPHLAAIPPQKPTEIGEIDRVL